MPLPVLIHPVVAASCRCVSITLPPEVLRFRGCMIHRKTKRQLIFTIAFQIEELCNRFCDVISRGSGRNAVESQRRAHIQNDRAFAHIVVELPVRQVGRNLFL